MPATVTRAAADPAAEPPEVLAAMRGEGLSAYRWDNGPHAVYAAHSHPYHKVLYCLRGSIRFLLGREGEAIDLRAGDRLDLPTGTEHRAVVGPEGVVCLAAQRGSRAARAATDDRPPGCCSEVPGRRGPGEASRADRAADTWLGTTSLFPWPGGRCLRFFRDASQATQQAAGMPVDATALTTVGAGRVFLGELQGRGRLLDVLRPSLAGRPGGRDRDKAPLGLSRS